MGITLAEQVNILFDTMTDPEGKSYTMQQVSSVVNVSLAGLSRMRSGEITNPSITTLKQICKFFDISLDYFQCYSEEDCRAYLRQADSRIVRKRIEDLPPPLNAQVFLRSMGLSDEAQRDLLAILKWVRAADQTDEDETVSATG